MKDDGYIMSKLVEYQKLVQNYLSDRWTREVGQITISSIEFTSYSKKGRV